MLMPSPPPPSLFPGIHLHRRVPTAEFEIIITMSLNLRQGLSEMDSHFPEQ